MNDACSDFWQMSSHFILHDAVLVAWTPFHQPVLDAGLLGILAYAVSPEADQFCTWGTLNSSGSVQSWLRQHAFNVPAPRWQPHPTSTDRSQQQVSTLVSTLASASADDALDRQGLACRAFQISKLPQGSDAQLVSEVITTLQGIDVLTSTPHGGSSDRTNLHIRCDWCHQHTSFTCRLSIHAPDDDTPAELLATVSWVSSRPPIILWKQLSLALS